MAEASAAELKLNVTQRIAAGDRSGNRDKRRHGDNPRSSLMAPTAAIATNKLK